MMRPLILMLATAIVTPAWHPSASAQQQSQPVTGQQPALDAAARSMAQRLGYCAAFFKPSGEAAQQLQFSGLLSQADATRFLLWFYFSASTPIPDPWRQLYDAAHQHGVRDAASASMDRIADVYRFCKPVTPSAPGTEMKPAPTTSGAAPERLPPEMNGVLARKLKRCWQVTDVGGAAAPPVVHLIIDMAENGRPTDVKLDAETQAQLAGNTRLRAFASAALRAVLDPRCQPLLYQRERTNQFRRFVLTLDPSRWR